jgi:hypothetical protein
MKKMIVALSVMAASNFVVDNVQAQGVCLDYWIKGPAACKTKKPEKKQKIFINAKSIKGDATVVQKDEERVQYEAALNKRIDKFLANYGKPPREFVAFHLDPSLENAVRWAKKFREETERTSKIAVAWKQAEALFQEYRDTGTVTLPAESGVTEGELKYLMKALEEESTDLPKVKGFGVDLEGNWDEDRLGADYTRLRYKEKKEGMSLSDMKEFSLSNLPKAYSDSASYKKAQDVIKKDSSQKVSAEMEPIEVNYYFSAKCAFCAKFSKSLTSAIKEVGKKNVKLTCVDMTPGEKSRSHSAGIDCKWRPILDGEAKKLGIKRTPTIVVKRSGSESLELLENYHESYRLVKYFKQGSSKGSVRK